MEEPPSAVTVLVAERRALRTAEDWTGADALRGQINALGFEIKDVGLETTVAPFAAVAETKRLRAERSQRSQRALQIIRAQSGDGSGGGDGARISVLVGSAVGGDDGALADALAEIPRCRTKRNRKVRAHRKEQKKRSAAFANWLFATFSREVGADRSALAMARRPRVLDVAGGSGGLCWEVATTHGARCTVIDPQPLRFGAAKTGALIRRLRSGGKASAEQSSSGVSGSDGSSGSSARAGAAVNGPAAKRARVTAPRAALAAAAEAAVAGADEVDEAVEVTWLDAKVRARLPAATRAGLAVLLRDEIGVAQHRCLFDVAFAQRSAAFAEADLITG